MLLIWPIYTCHPSVVYKVRLCTCHVKYSPPKTSPTGAILLTNLVPLTPKQVPPDTFFRARAMARAKWGDHFFLRRTVFCFYKLSGGTKFVIKIDPGGGPVLVRNYVFLTVLCADEL